VNLLKGVEILIENSHNYANIDTYTELIEISIYDIEIRFYIFYRHNKVIGQIIFNIYKREAIQFFEN
jgi:hypothetical protein